MSAAAAPYTDPRTRCDRTPAWGLLAQRYQHAGRAFDLRAAFAQDGAARVAHFSQQAPHIHADLSKNLIDEATEALLLQLARECGVEAYRDAMFAGRPINHTEQRAVMHWLLRNPAPAPAAQAPAATSFVADAAREVHASLHAMLGLAEQVRQDAAITDIVNIGIGGSDLGPSMAAKALDDLRPAGKRLHFISNVDGMELGSLLRTLRPESTLFLIASKTFTTLETMTNAQAARDWFIAQGGTDVARHFWALTTNRSAAAQFGIETTLGFWDWVGGRYSLWSAIGLPIAIAIGAGNFRQLLAGAHAMDEHFRTAPLAQNLPVRLALLDVWYRNFHGFATRCVAPYSHGLRRLPAYLQQLEMESNGKGVDASGAPLPYATAPVVWGEPGTNGQHAFFQMIHQGPDIIPVEFIALRRPGRDLPAQHARLVANALAQAKALMRGRESPDNPHRAFSGNRPSTFLVLEQLSPEALGALIALYEHRVFVAGAVWGINSFDQWGVELGKVLAQGLEPRLASGDAAGLDASTAALLRQLI
ncbi:glucose-6-phosphate isomerase [Pulveribacter suum]|uniref:Glucose-6-phosphate isomerase n=1 Tax=Pulveribacter suum TaxID=2116657 RepID=A0A2P1NNW3_9BURK|nr:glucose-6-phosphate isomerase [Pulveribacter suum]AVP58745.1 glucose-6-phosphate isomerase [Pulveribacter suum]